MNRKQWALIALLTAAMSVGCAGTRKKLRRAEAYLSENNPRAAARIYASILDRRPTEARGLDGVALSWVEAGEPDNALALVEAIAPDAEPLALQARVRVFLALGRGAEVLDEAQEVAEALGTPTAWVHLAEAHLAAGDLHGAVEAGERGLERGGGRDAALATAWTHTRLGNRDRAERLVRRAVEGEPRPVHLLAAASVWSLLGHDEGAEKWIRAARANLSEPAEHWWKQAALRDQGGDREGAIRWLSLAIALDPDQGEWIRARGALWLAVREADLAETDLERALEMDPYRPDADKDGLQISQAGAHAGPVDQVVREEVIRIWGEIAQANAMQDDAVGVAVAEEQVLRRTGSQQPGDWLRVAGLWEAAGETNRALDLLEASLDFAHDHWGIRLGLASLFSGSGDMGKAIGHARIAWSLAPGEAAVAIQLAEICLALGTEREARQVLKQALEADPVDARVVDMWTRMGH